LGVLVTDDLGHAVALEGVAAGPIAERIHWVADGYRVEFPGQLSESEFGLANRLLYPEPVRVEWCEDRASVTLFGGPEQLGFAQRLFRPKVRNTATAQVHYDQVSVCKY
jgi:hypothetical protein